MLRRWPRSSRPYLWAAVALSVATGLMLRSYLASASAKAGGGPTRPVVVASAAIARGHRLETNDLRVVRVPSPYVQPGALTDPAKAAGRVALTDLSTGEAVTRTRLARVRAGPVSSLVPRGLRAFAVPTSLPAAALSPGDHVDVLATFQGGQPHTESVVVGVEVLFVLGGQATSTGGASLDASGSGASEATTLLLLVSPDQERRLAFARAFADLEVTIAPPDDG